MILECINDKFSICKVNEIKAEQLQQEYTFVSTTDRERSIICKTTNVPEDVLIVENGWRGFRIAEDAAFEKYGMIAELTSVIAGAKTGVLVVATYDTDYLFIKEPKFEEVKKALEESGSVFK